MEKIAISRQQSESAYLNSAPEALILHHRVTGVGKEILGRLLTQPKMDKAWPIISSHVKVQIYTPTGQPYGKDNPNEAHHLFWSQIVSIIFKSRAPEKSSVDLDDDLEKIEQSAKDLRNLIIDPDRTAQPWPRTAEPKTGARFDYPYLYDYFAAEVMELNMQEIPRPDDAWEQANPMERDQIAFHLLRVWPHLSEVLDELIEKIGRERKKEKERELPVKRVRKIKDNGSNEEKRKKEEERKRQERFFVVMLAKYLERELKMDRKTESIPVTAAIAAAVFDQKVLRSFVFSALRGK